MKIIENPLIEATADVNAEALDGTRPIDQGSGHIEVVKALMAANADVHATIGKDICKGTRTGQEVLDSVKDEMDDLLDDECLQALIAQNERQEEHRDEMNELAVEKALQEAVAVPDESEARRDGVALVLEEM